MLTATVHPCPLVVQERIIAELEAIVEARRNALASEAAGRTVQHRRACARYIQSLNRRTAVLHAQLAA